MLRKARFYRKSRLDLIYSIFRTGAKIEAKGNAVLNDPFDPLVPGELVVNFDSQPSFSKLRFITGCSFAIDVFHDIAKSVIFC